MPLIASPADPKPRRWGLYAAAAGSASLLALAFEHRLLAYLVLVALVPWFGALRTCSRRQAALSSAVFGVVLFAFQMWWVVPFVGRWTGNFALAIVPWAVVLLLAFLVYLPLGLALRSSLQGWRVALAPMVWVSHEVLRAYLPELAFPWAYVGTPLVVHPELVQHAAWGTVWLVSATTVGFNIAALYATDCWREGQWGARPLVAFGCSALLPLLALSRLNSPLPPGRLKFTLAQHGYDMAFGDPNGRSQAFATFTRAAVAVAKSAGSDLLVFPEGFSQTDATDGPPLTSLGFEPEVPSMFGSFRTSGGKTYQAAYLFDGVWSHSDKTKLVVFGEFVPFRNQLPFLKSFNLSPVDLTAGEMLQVMHFRGVKLGPMVCFEGVFPELGVKEADLGAQVFVQMSIDDWYAGTQAHEQLWKSSVWRSIENGLPLVRVGAQGQSLVTDFRGRVVNSLQAGKPQAETVEVAVPASSDGFRYRYWFAWLSVAAGLASLVASLLEPRAKSA